MRCPCAQFGAAVPGRSNAQWPVPVSRRQEHGAAHARRLGAQSAGELETRWLFAGGGRATAGGATRAARADPASGNGLAPRGSAAIRPQRHAAAVGLLAAARRELCAALISEYGIIDA